jgi:hypothetical protein
MSVHRPTAFVAAACGICPTGLALVLALLVAPPALETHAGWSTLEAGPAVNRDRKGDRLAVMHQHKTAGTEIGLGGLFELSIGRHPGDLLAVWDAAGQLRFVVDARSGLTAVTETPSRAGLVPDPFDEPSRPQGPPSPTVPFGCEPLASSSTDPRIAGLTGKCMSDAATGLYAALSGPETIHQPAFD